MAPSYYKVYGKLLLPLKKWWLGSFDLAVGKNRVDKNYQQSSGKFRTLFKTLPEMAKFNYLNSEAARQRRIERVALDAHKDGKTLSEVFYNDNTYFNHKLIEVGEKGAEGKYRITPSKHDMVNVAKAVVDIATVSLISYLTYRKKDIDAEIEDSWLYKTLFMAPVSNIIMLNPDWIAKPNTFGAGSAFTQVKYAMNAWKVAQDLTKLVISDKAFPDASLYYQKGSKDHKHAFDGDARTVYDILRILPAGNQIMAALVALHQFKYQEEIRTQTDAGYGKKSIDLMKQKALTSDPNYVEAMRNVSDAKEEANSDVDSAWANVWKNLSQKEKDELNDYYKNQDMTPAQIKKSMETFAKNKQNANKKAKGWKQYIP